MDHFKVPVNVLDDFRVWRRETEHPRELLMRYAKEPADARRQISNLTQELAARGNPTASVKPASTHAATQKTRIVYFTMVYLGGEESGGTLVCVEHIRMLASLENVDLTVVTIGPVAQLDVLAEIGAKHINLNYLAPKRSLRPNNKSMRPWKRWPFVWELLARSQPQIRNNVEAVVHRTRPEVIVVDYVLSAVWVPTIYRLPIRRVTITLNREAEFFHLTRRIGKVQPEVSPSVVAEWRLRRFENWVYRHSDAVVALSKGDVPKHLPRGTEGVAIEPMLGDRAPRWRYGATKRLFFVGNVAHFPNYEAVEWLATRFAPELEKRDPAARIVIIGAAKEGVPETWVRPNVEYRGFASKEEVRDGFVNSDLFIVPIANDFGSKIKVLECIAYGMPLMSTKAGLSGIPFSHVVPQFHLDDPQGAAQLAYDLMSDSTRLENLGEKLAAEMRAERVRSARSWHDLIQRVISRPLAPRHTRRGPKLLAARGRRPGRMWPGNSKTALEIAASEADVAAFTGVYGLEHYRGRPLRWTNGEAEILVLLDSGMLPTKLLVTLWNITPDAGTDIRILANDVELHSGHFEGKRHFIEELELPDLTEEECLSVRIESSVFRHENDDRALGVAIESMKLVY